MVQQPGATGTPIPPEDIRQFARDVYDWVEDARAIQGPPWRHGEWVRVDQAVMDFVALVHEKKAPNKQTYWEIAYAIIADHRRRNYNQMQKLPRGPVFAKVQFALRDIISGRVPSPSD